MADTPINAPAAPKERYPLIDLIRGVAVVLMVFFHTSYDLKMFGAVKIDFQNDGFWYALPRVIVFLFLTATGMSLALTHTPRIRHQLFWKRVGKLAFFACLISAITYFLFPATWIYFGTLHCIAVCSVMALPFLHRPRLALALGAPLLVAAFVFKVKMPWPILPHLSMDYIPAIPWVGVVLLGIFAHYRGWHRSPTSYPRWPLRHQLEFLGRHSLLIYLLHQPLLFGLFTLLFKLL